MPWDMGYIGYGKSITNRERLGFFIGRGGKASMLTAKPPPPSHNTGMAFTVGIDVIDFYGQP